MIYYMFIVNGKILSEKELKERLENDGLFPSFIESFISDACDAGLLLKIDIERGLYHE